MNQTIKRAFRSLHFSLGLHAIKAVPGNDDISKLLQKLAPQDCDIPLIRVGGKGDGGYLIPDDLEGLEYCFSPGVNMLSNFENELADRGIRSFLADYSVDGPPIHRAEFTFDKKFLGSYDDDVYFTLASWKQKYLGDYSGDLLLQMDIEGCEYDVLLSTSAPLLAQFRIVVIEFHELDRLFDPFAFRVFQSCFQKLLNSFHVVHIHPNSYAEVVQRDEIAIPTSVEITFLNKKRVRHTQPQRSFPHPLDMDCDPGREVILPRCWYSPEA